MDESFLSEPLVIEASRDFVCVRLTTYENQTEHDFMKKLYGRSNQKIENTTFAILSPDQKDVFVRPGRSPHFSYRNPVQLAAHMYKIADEYREQPSMASSGIAPIAANVKIALNIAASDKLPLVVAVADSEQARKSVEANLSEAAWNEKLVGRFAMVSTADAGELKSIELGDFEQATNNNGGYLVVQPGKFGTNGKVLAHIAADSDKLAESLLVGIEKFKVWNSLPHRAHIEKGAEQGVFWETNLPVTDRMEARARERTKQMIKEKRR